MFEIAIDHSPRSLGLSRPDETHIVARSLNTCRTNSRNTCQTNSPKFRPVLLGKRDLFTAECSGKRSALAKKPRFVQKILVLPVRIELTTSPYQGCALPAFGKHPTPGGDHFYFTQQRRVVVRRIRSFGLVLAIIARLARRAIKVGVRIICRWISYLACRPLLRPSSSMSKSSRTTFTG